MAGAFKKLSDKLQRKGYSPGYADAVAAKIGEKKYGKKGMAKKAAAGRKRAERMMNHGRDVRG